MALGALGIGTGLSGLISGYNAGQQALGQKQLLQQLLQSNKLKNQQAQQGQQAQGVLFQALAGDNGAPPGFTGGITGIGSGLAGGMAALDLSPQPPMPGQPSAPSASPSTPQTGSPTSLAPPPQQRPAPRPQPTEQQIIQRESGGNPNVGYTPPGKPLTDLSRAPLDKNGFPVWSGAQGPAGISHGAGLYQFQPGEWAKYAGPLGIKDFSRASQKKVYEAARAAEGAKPWAASEPVGKQIIAEAPPPMQKASGEVATAAAQTIPPDMYGRISLRALAQRIEKVAPNADPAVKMMALEQANKLLAPSEKIMQQLFMEQQRESFRSELSRVQQADRMEMEALRTRDKPEAQGQIITGADGKQYSVRGGVATAIQGLPEGEAHRLSSASQSAVSPEATKLVAEGIANYQFPPLTSWAMKSPSGQQTMAEVLKLNPDYDATKFTGKQSGARAIGTRSANLTMATDVAEQMIPLTEQTSQKIDRTEYPTINAMELAVEKGTGDENVVRFMEQINSLKYVYARALNPTGTARVQDLKRFDDILNQAWSKGQVSAALDQMRISLGAERKGVDQATGKTPATPAATPEAAPSDGEIVIQKGYQYRKQGDQYVPVGPAQQ